MILGLSTSAFTIMHVALSLIGIAAGVVAVAGMLAGKTMSGWTALFLAATILTSVTGFFFQSAGLLPSHVFGIISLVVLALALLALYVNHLAGPWRWIYVVGVVLALYLNAFVAVVQAFQKVPALHPFAPTQSERPFLVAQLVLLAVFVIVGWLAVVRFRPQPV
jgi:hypothetical protein